MNESLHFLKYVIHEDIYLIDADLAETDDKQKLVNGGVDSINIEAAPKVELVKPVLRSNDILVIYDNVLGKKMLITELDYLEKILGAIGKSVDLIDCQNVAVENPSYNGYQYVLCFTPNHKLPIPTIQYEKVSFDGSLFVVTDSLTNISSSIALRKKLWSVLQSIFLVSP